MDSKSGLDWKQKAVEVDRMVDAELAKADQVTGRDPILDAAYRAITQAMEQPGVVVRVTIEYTPQLRTIGETLDLGFEWIDFAKTRKALTVETLVDSVAPFSVEFCNGSAIEFVVPVAFRAGVCLFFVNKCIAAGV